MMQSKFIEEITAKLSELVAQSPLKDFEKNSRAEFPSRITAFCFAMNYQNSSMAP